jgi:hypothetical protein
MHDFVMGVWGWIATHPLAGLGGAVALALMLWKRPKQTVKLALALLVLVALGYLVSGIVSFTMDSAVGKERMIEKGPQ